MKSILSGILIAVGIGVVASFVLSEMQRPAFNSFATSSVRVGDPGSNLVGSEWSQLESVEEAGT